MDGKNKHLYYKTEDEDEDFTCFTLTHAPVKTDVLVVSGIELKHPQNECYLL